MANSKKSAGQPGARRTNIQTRRFLAARAAEIGGVAVLAREIKRPDQTVKRMIEGGLVREATARDFIEILRRLGFVGPTGLEPVTLPMAPAESSDSGDDPTRPAA